MLRCYEAYGQAAAIDGKQVLGVLLSPRLNPNTVERTNLLERPNSAAATVSHPIAPWTIATFKLSK